MSPTSWIRLSPGCGAFPGLRVAPGALRRWGRDLGEFQPETFELEIWSACVRERCPNQAAVRLTSSLARWTPPVSFALASTTTARSNPLTRCRRLAVLRPRFRNVASRPGRNGEPRVCSARADPCILQRLGKGGRCAESRGQIPLGDDRLVVRTHQKPSASDGTPSLVC